MKTPFKIGLFATLAFCAINAQAQYYYKDIIGTKETTAMMKAYLQNKVAKVRMVSYDGEGVKNDEVMMEQTFSSQSHLLRTVTKSEASDESVLLSYVDEKGQVIKTIDSSTVLTSITTYQYNADGLLEKMESNSSDTANSISDKEVHQWIYKDGKIVRMYRIKNGNDTAFVAFKLDEGGNVIEEQSTRKGIKSDPVYYYYDAQNRLTDIVRYNKKAKKLLPEYMFEYAPTNQVIQRITVPANGSKYLIWRYQYDDRGLKIREAVFDKYKQLNGKVEYQYSFHS